jgi:hypothetical protein
MPRGPGWFAARLLTRCRRALRFARQEALAAEDRTALGGLEGNRSFPPTLRARGHGFAFRKSAARTLSFGLAGFAAFGFIFEVLIVEEMLLSRGKNKICSAIYTLKDSILKLRHGHFPVNLNYG